MTDTQAAPGSAPILGLVDVSKTYHLGTERSNWRALVPGRLGDEAFDASFLALDRVDLDVRAGEILGIVGRNGAGKSTALKVLAGVVRATSGTVVRSGRVVAIIELGVGFDPDFTGRENIFFAGGLLGLSPEDVAARYDGIVAFSELGEFMDMPVKRYSSGMLARLGFSLACEVDADVILVDEALSVGDVHFRRKCLDRIAALNAAGVAFVVVSHDHGLLAEICDDLVLLEQGRVAARGQARTVLDRYLGTGAIEEVGALPGDEPWAPPGPEDIEPGAQVHGPVGLEDLEVPAWVEPGGSLAFRVRVEVREASAGRLWVSVFTFGNSICTEPIEVPGDVLARPGRWLVAGQVPDLPLASGDFELRVAASEHGLSSDRRFIGAAAEASAPFSIRGGDHLPRIAIDLTWVAEADQPATGAVP